MVRREPRADPWSRGRRPWEKVWEDEAGRQRGQLGEVVGGLNTVLLVTNFKHCILFLIFFKTSWLRSVSLGNSMTEFTFQAG